MPVKAYNPTTPARRGMTSQDLSDITTRKPLKSLIKAKKQNAGRNTKVELLFVIVEAAFVVTTAW